MVAILHQVTELESSMIGASAPGDYEPKRRSAMCEEMGEMRSIMDAHLTSSRNEISCLKEKMAECVLNNQRLRAQYVANNTTNSNEDDEDNGPILRAGFHPEVKSASSPPWSSPREQMASRNMTAGAPPEEAKQKGVIIDRRLPTVPKFRAWKLDLCDKVAKESGLYDLGHEWIHKVENFPVLDARLASVLSQVLVDGELKRKVQATQEYLAESTILLKGRQIQFMIMSIMTICVGLLSPA